jgi:hypothetical protein
VERSLAERPFDFPRLRAIQLAIAFPGDSGMPWPWQPWSWSSKERVVTFTAKGPVITLPTRHIRDDGSEIIAIQIRWRGFTKREIAEAMREFARSYWPRNDDCKEPTRRGKRPQLTIRSHLKALSVMRIYKLQRNPWKRLKLVENVCRYKGCVSVWAAYKKRCKQGHGDEPMSRSAKVEMSRARADARTFFQILLPGEEPTNY